MNINNNQVQIDKGYKINKVTKTRHKKKYSDHFKRWIFKKIILIFEKPNFYYFFCTEILCDKTTMKF